MLDVYNTITTHANSTPTLHNILIITWLFINVDTGIIFDITTFDSDKIFNGFEQNNIKLAN